METTIIHKELSFGIMGACFEVYNVKSSGFAEPVYQECLEVELNSRSISFNAQPKLNLEYKGTPLRHPYIPDFLVNGEVILEIKAVKNLLDEHRAQVINYLKSTRLQLGLLVNFGHHGDLEWERIVL